MRAIRKAWVYDVRREAAEVFADEMGTALGVEIVAASSARDAVREADIVCTATLSTQPVFEDGDIAPGTHINAIGSYKPKVQEIPAGTVQRALLVVDHRESALAETGDLIIPIARGLIEATDIHAELGEIVAGKATGRTSDSQVTLFKSVGVAIQDLAAAARAFERAQATDLGKIVAI